MVRFFFSNSQIFMLWGRHKQRGMASARGIIWSRGSLVATKYSEWSTAGSIKRGMNSSLTFLWNPLTWVNQRNTLKNTLKTQGVINFQGTGLIMGGREKRILALGKTCYGIYQRDWRILEIYYGMFIRMTRGSERERWWNRRNVHGKIEGKAGKREWLSVNFWLARMFASLNPVCGHQSPSHLIKCYS